ncbi:uncharacterized protein LOC111683596 isoform X2 [Lucilia cuprina]|uniref:uncharacterized protein LOC111683596 isoform X2 n=1 Tax=Lucilia cuprina TaxID=7375 RepID=UPI001F05EBFD|nr:uncharacterized protein LOC111683596 isoform X2 [Lucilia cuprina]
MNSLEKYRFCFLAGLCAVGGSFFGKLPSLLKDNSVFGQDQPIIAKSWQIYAEFAVYQAVPLVLMVFSNLLNWRYFLKALQLTEQTLTATVLTAASNYIVSVLWFLRNTLAFIPYSDPLL